MLRSSAGRVDSSLNIAQVTDVLAEIRFRTLYVDYFSDKRTDTSQRVIDFYLAGPRKCWNLFAIREVHSDGTTNFFRRKRPQQSITIDTSLKIKCVVKQSFLYARTLATQQLTSSVYVLSFSTQIDAIQLSDKRFIETCTEVAERILLLASFVSESFISWFRRVLYTRSGIRETVRDIWVRNDKRSYVNLNFCPVDVKHFYSFLQTGLAVFGPSATSDIQILIELYVAGSAAQFSEERFITLYRAIEKFVAVHVYTIDVNIIEKNRWSKLHKKIRRVVNETITDANVADDLNASISWSNRRPVKAQFELLMSNLGIPWRDVADPEKPFSLFDLRNQMLHNPGPVDIKVLDREIVRAKAIVRMLIFSMLGWRRWGQASWEFRFLEGQRTWG